MLGNTHPADAARARLKASQFGRQRLREIDRPQDTHLVSVRSPGDGSRRVVDILPPHLPNCTNSTTGGFGQDEGEFETNPPELLNRTIWCSRSASLNRTTSRFEAFLTRHWATRGRCS